jgi:hypothetical protein
MSKETREPPPIMLTVTERPGHKIQELGVFRLPTGLISIRREAYGERDGIYMSQRIMLSDAELDAIVAAVILEREKTNTKAG